MALYVYVKKNQSLTKKAVNSFSYLLLISGALLLFWAFYPVISFEIYSKLFIERRFQTPIPSSIVKSLNEGGSVLSSQVVFSNNLRDFTNVNLWFPSSHFNTDKKINLKEYKLSIPKLNIKEARVVVGGEDLSQSLVHFYPQSLPGEYGNVVILGHSTLPQLYNPRDYKTIFTYLPSLTVKDRIYLIVDNIKYEYEIFDMFVVNPDEISVLEQKTDGSYLTLITCVPPGTYWKRLVVRAKLVSLPLE